MTLIALLVTPMAFSHTRQETWGPDGQLGYKAEFSSSSSLSPLSQLSLLKYPVPMKPFWNSLERKRQFPSCHFPLPQHSSPTTTNKMETTPGIAVPSAEKQPLLQLIVIQQQICMLHHVTNGMYLRDRGPKSGIQSLAMDGTEVTHPWVSHTTLIQITS